MPAASPPITLFPHKPLCASRLATVGNNGQPQATWCPRSTTHLQHPPPALHDCSSCHLGTVHSRSLESAIFCRLAISPAAAQPTFLFHSVFRSLGDISRARVLCLGRYQVVLHASPSSTATGLVSLCGHYRYIRQAQILLCRDATCRTSPRSRTLRPSSAFRRRTQPALPTSSPNCPTFSLFRFNPGVLDEQTGSACWHCFLGQIPRPTGILSLIAN